MTVSFARFQNDTGNVEIAIDTQTVSTETINVEEQSQETVQSPYAETPEIPSTTAASKTPTTWKKITRAFVNPLFGEPSANVTQFKAYDYHTGRCMMKIYDCRGCLAGGACRH